MAKPPVPHPVLTTARLTLRQFRPDDAAGLHRCLSDPEAMQFWNTPPHGKMIETERAVRNFTDCTPSYYRFWAVADRQTDGCIGMVNYHDGHIRSRRAAIGYIIGPALVRRGFATEAVSAMIGHCFETLRYRLEAFIHPDNAASPALAEKTGATI
eukprot:gene4319-4368_t